MDKVFRSFLSKVTAFHETYYRCEAEPFCKCEQQQKVREEFGCGVASKQVLRGPIDLHMRRIPFDTENVTSRM